MDRNSTLAVEEVPIGRPQRARSFSGQCGIISTSEPGDPSAGQEPGEERRGRWIYKASVCPDCGVPRFVRPDVHRASGNLCKSCSLRRAAKTRRNRSRRGRTVPCAVCGDAFYAHPSQSDKRFCSARCASLGRRKYLREQRQCAGCGVEFTWAPKPFSNSSGHYCTRRCRNRAYRGVIHGDASRPARTSRSAWRSLRRAFVESGHATCVVCNEEPRRLEVHHIVHHRHTDPDDASCLVAVCHRHHMLLEEYTRLIDPLPASERRLAAFLLLGVLNSYWSPNGERFAKAERD